MPSGLDASLLSNIKRRMNFFTLVIEGFRNISLCNKDRDYTYTEKKHWDKTNKAS